MPLLDRDHVRRHHVELSMLTGRFMVDHLVRVQQAFGGDLVAAIVLGTIGQHNVRRFIDEVAMRSEEPVDDLVARGEHMQYLRPCNAMSVSVATGVPRETVRRKIRWLIEQGWVQQVGRDKLFITSAAARHFKEFDVETIERFHAAAVQVLMTLQKRTANAPASPATVPTPALAPSPAARTAEVATSLRTRAGAT